MNLNLIPVPHGWTYMLIDGLPSIERNVGDHYSITIALDEGKWVWWLCHRGKDTSFLNGESDDMVESMFQALDALVLSH